MRAKYRNQIFILIESLMNYKCFSEKNGRIYNAFVGEKSSEERKVEPAYTEDQAGDYFEK